MILKLQSPVAITVQPEIRVTFSELRYDTVDDTERKILTVAFKPATPMQKALPSLQIKDPDYTTLGQWTDDSLQNYIAQRLGVTVAS